MQLSRTQRKMILLYARLIDIAELGEPLPSGGTVILSNRSFVWTKYNCEIVKIEYIQTHRTAAAPHADAEEIIELNRTLPLLFQAEWKEANPISNDQLGVFSFAKRIGLLHGRARYIIDQEFARQIPTFSFASQTQGQAEEFTGKHGGLYHLYRHDINKITQKKGYSQGAIVRGTVSIRYPVPYSALDSENQGKRRIRCKINIPSYNDRVRGNLPGYTDLAPVYKYDGYVKRQKSGRWLWLLQSRPYGAAGENPDLDLMLMHTELPKDRAHEDSAVMTGALSTQNQEDEMYPMISKIVLIREKKYSVAKPDDERHRTRHPKCKLPYLCSHQIMVPEDERAFMRGEPRVIDLSDSNTWTPRDKRAIEMLFEGRAPINCAGLHR